MERGKQARRTGYLRQAIDVSKLNSFEPRQLFGRGQVRGYFLERLLGSATMSEVENRRWILAMSHRPSAPSALNDSPRVNKHAVHVEQQGTA